MELWGVKRIQGDSSGFSISQYLSISLKISQYPSISLKIFLNISQYLSSQGDSELRGNYGSQWEYKRVKGSHEASWGVKVSHGDLRGVKGS